MEDRPVAGPRDLLKMETRRPTSPGAEALLGKYFPVLDHGFVALVDYMGTDECIERAARVSYGQGTRKTSETRGLLRYLHSHLHTTPSEMVELKFHCCMPIFVARQWIRHRTASVNEQGSGEEMPLEVTDAAVAKWNAIRAQTVEHYEQMTADGVARELARIDLPLSTYTQWYWKIDLHNLMHFLSLRVEEHAQKEIRVYGEIMAGMFKRIAPISFEAWIDYDVCGARFSRQEMIAIADACNGLRPNTSLLTKREQVEFLQKLSRDYADPQSFELDTSKATVAEYFERKFAGEK